MEACRHLIQLLKNSLLFANCIELFGNFSVKRMKTHFDFNINRQSDLQFNSKLVKGVRSDVVFLCFVEKVADRETNPENQ